MLAAGQVERARRRRRVRSHAALLVALHMGYCSRRCWRRPAPARSVRTPVRLLLDRVRAGRRRSRRRAARSSRAVQPGACRRCRPNWKRYQGRHSHSLAILQGAAQPTTTWRVRAERLRAAKVCAVVLLGQCCCALNPGCSCWGHAARARLHMHACVAPPHRIWMWVSRNVLAVLRPGLLKPYPPSWPCGPTSFAWRVCNVARGDQEACCAPTGRACLLHGGAPPWVPPQQSRLTGGAGGGAGSAVPTCMHMYLARAPWPCIQPSNKPFASALPAGIVHSTLATVPEPHTSTPRKRMAPLLF